MGKQRHVVNRLIVEVLTSDDKGARIISEKMNKIIQSDLIGDVEKIFDELIDTDNTYRFDKLVLDLGNINKNNFENEFEEKLILKLKNELKEKIIKADQRFKKENISTSSEGDKSINTKEADLDLIKYFLVNGSLPWWGSKISISDIESIIKNQLDKDSNEIINLLSENKTALKRAALQLSENLLIHLLKKSYAKMSSLPTEDRWLNEKHKKLNHLSGLRISFSKFRNKFWREYFYSQFSDLSKSFNEKDLEYLAGTAYINFPELKFDDRRKITDQIAKLSSNRVSVNDESKSDYTSNESGNVPKDGIFINNAGLILLAPFMKEFFKRLGLIEGNEFLDNHCQIKAVHILQFAVTGKTKNPEFLLSLNKILCGTSSQTIIPIEIEISEEEKNETENLLMAVITNFEAIKNTSVEGFRKSFLEREGKITAGEFNWNLMAERKSYDLILEKLPWSISIIKLPWMEKPINVEW